MTKKEKERYQELSKIQKDFVDALKSIGFTYKYTNVYEKPDWGEINVKEISTWAGLLKKVFQQGKDQKRFEFQRVLGVW